MGSDQLVLADFRKMALYRVFPREWMRVMGSDRLVLKMALYGVFYSVPLYMMYVGAGLFGLW
jgi:hypothetical protein